MTGFNTQYIRRHGAQILLNLRELKLRYMDGKISKEEYAAIKADGKKALAELRATPRKD